MTTLRVQRRNMETKAKKLRREGYVTGNLFGKEIEGSIPVQIEKSEAERIQRECMKGSQLYLELEGKTYDVLIKEMDYNTMNHQILEIDFQALVKGEKVHSVAEIVLHNKEKVVEGVLEQLLEEISYKATPEELVEKVEIDCSSLRLGDIIKVSDLDIAKNDKIELQTHLDTPIVSVVASKNVQPAEDEEETPAEAEQEEAAEKDLNEMTADELFAYLMTVSGDDMDALYEKYPNLDMHVYCIRNDFFGETITVAGLITGQDLKAQLTGQQLGDRLLLPVSMFRNEEDVFLDDMTISQLEEALQVRIDIVKSSGQDLIDAILQMEE